MLRVFILLGLATAVAPDPDCQGVECAQKFVEDAAAKVGARVRQGLRDGIDDMQEAGMPAMVADLGRSVFPAIPEQTSSSSISSDEASTLENLPEEFDFDDKLVEFKDDLNPNLVRDLEDENGVCDEADENGSCVEEDHDDVEYAEDKEAEEDEEFDEEEFFENEVYGLLEEEEGDDSGDGTNGDGEYDPRSEREQLQDPQFDQFEWAGHRGGRGSSIYKFDLRESRRGRAFEGLSRTDRVLFCLSKTTNKHDAIDIVGDFGERVRSVWTHRDSIGVAIGQGSRHWARGQTHGETVVTLNLMLGIKNVNDEKVNLADDRSSHAYDVRTLGLLVDFEMVEQDSESLELRPGPKMKCVWGTGLKSFTLADSLTFSMDVALAGGHSNTDNNIMKCWAGVDRMKNVLVFNGWPWAREEYGLVQPQVALAQFHAFYEFYSPSPEIMGQVDGGDFKEGLQLRLMDPSTGGPYSAWYKFKGSEIVKIQKAGINRRKLALFSLEIDAARQMTKDAVYLATGLDAPDGLRAGSELPPWVPGSLNLRGLFTGGFSLYKGYVSYDGGTLFCNLGVQYYTFDGSTLLLDKGEVPKMMKPTVAAEQTVADARAMRDEVVKDDAYLGRLHKRDRERDVARGAEPPPPPSRRRWVPKKTWDAYVARGEREPRPTPRRWPRPTPRPTSGPTPRPWSTVITRHAGVGRGNYPRRLSTKRDPVEDLRGEEYDLYGIDEAFRVLYTKKPNLNRPTPELALAAFEYLDQYEDFGPEDGRFEGIDVRSELKARAHGVDVFIYDKDQGTPFDEGVEVWAEWTQSTIYLGPDLDENAIAMTTLKKNVNCLEGRSGRAYALAEPVRKQDFEFVNYPAYPVLVVADYKFCRS